MTNSQLKHFQERLERRLEELGPRIREEERLAQEFPGAVNDTGDNAVRDLYSDTDLTLGQQHTEELRAIERALERIARGEYGKCEVGGEDIALERLEALPTATTCSEHAARPERLPPSL